MTRAGSRAETGAAPLAGRLRALLRDRAGASFVIFALAAPIVVGATGMGVETGLWYMVRRQAQTAADAGAIAGAVVGLRGNETAVIAGARDAAARNGFATASDTSVSVIRTVQAGVTRVDVTVTRAQPLLFTSLFLSEPVPIAAHAAAITDARGEACVLALHPTSQAAVSFGGNPVALMGGCVVAANSSAGNAIDIAGNSTLVADSLWTVGGVDNGGSTSVTLSKGMTTGTWPLPDPFADKDLTAPTSCTQSGNMNINNAVTLIPGTYCGSIAITSNGVLTLTPGTYYIRNGDLTVQAQGQLTCTCPNPTDGVTIILSGTNPGSVDVRGGAALTLRAPSAVGHPWRGILFAQSPNAPANSVNKLNGGATMNLSGALYFPAQALQFAGNNSASASGCTKLVARTISFHGDSSIANGGCSAMGAEVSPTRIARLVE